MQQIIVRHLTGSHAGKVESFRADLPREITIGGDPGATIRLGPRLEVVVSHQHARRVTHRSQVLWVELASRDGQSTTVLNRRWLRGRVALRPGDRVRLRPGGPELEFAADGGPNPP